MSYYVSCSLLRRYLNLFFKKKTRSSQFPICPFTTSFLHTFNIEFYNNLSLPFMCHCVSSLAIPLIYLQISPFSMIMSMTLYPERKNKDLKLCIGKYFGLCELYGFYHSPQLCYPRENSHDNTSVNVRGHF